MSFKEHLKSALKMYFIIVTLINAAIYILGKTFRPDDRFGYEVLLSPLIYAAISLVPMLCMYSKKELTLKQYIFREVLQLIAIEVILIGLGLGTECLAPENLALTASFALSVLVIFVLVLLISWLLDLHAAKQINSDLKTFQSKFSEKTE
ncbi:MAG: hypothetical protein ACI4JY_00090 [Oscillospiraceae bacterium]